MGHPTYLYHPEQAREGKIFDSDALPEKAEGWVDTPAKFAESVVPAPGDSPPTSAFGAWFASLGGSAHDKKLAIERYAREHFDVEIDRRRTVKQLVAEVEALEAGAGS